MQGTILDGSNNFFQVECDDGVTRTCSIKGKILKASTGYYNPLAPGDVAEIEPDKKTEAEGQITDLVPRRNEFVRWNIKKKCPQLMAANLDYLLVVTTPDEPPFRPRFTDRALAQAEYQNITPVIIANKYDLATSADPDFLNRLAVWESLGYRVLRISAKSGEGLQELAALVENHLSALVGQSGVGKSSLVNVLDSSCVLRTGSLSQKYGRGTHTTTKGTLMRITLNEALTGGVQGLTASIIDTPGVRRFILHDISADNLALYFREIRPYVGKCTFGMSCTHRTEPGCKVKEAAESGAISAERFDSWQRISEELRTGSFED